MSPIKANPKPRSQIRVVKKKKGKCPQASEFGTCVDECDRETDFSCNGDLKCVSIWSIGPFGPLVYWSII